MNNTRDDEVVTYKTRDDEDDNVVGEGNKGKGGNSGEVKADEPGKKTKRNYQAMKDAAGFRESSDNYEAKNDFGFMGRYQFGKRALRDIGFMDANENWTAKAKEYGVSSEKEFLDNPAAQDEAFDLYVKKQWSYIEAYGLKKYIGTKMNGVLITESGLVMSAHLVGIGGLIDALEANDLTSSRDNNEVPAK